jgi:hypothetical protein
VRYLVRFELDKLRTVEESLKMIGVTPVTKVLDYIVIDVPPELKPKIQEIPGVIELIEEKAYGIKAIIPVEAKLSRFMELGGPLSIPALLWSMNVKERERWTTSEARKMVGADIAESEGVTGKGVKVAVLDTGIDAYACPQLPSLIPNIGSSSLDGQPWWQDENGHGCIEPEAMVYTTFCGLTTIAELYERTPEPEHYINGGFVKFFDKPVYTIGFDGKPRITRIIAVHKIPYKGKAVRVIAGTSSFLTSIDHPFLVYDYRYGYKYVKAMDLIHANRNYGLVFPDEALELPFEKTIDEDTAYLAGLFIADGSFAKGAIWYSLHRDEAPIIMEYLRKLGYNCSIKAEKRRTRGRTIMVYGLIKKFKEVFGEDHSHIPEKLLKQPKTVLLALIAGIIDGDGSFDRNRARVRISTTNRKLAYQLVNLLSALGFKSRISSSKPRENEQTLYQVSVIGESCMKLLKELSPYLKLKKPQWFKTRNFRPWLWIKKVELIDYDGYFYDLTTETQNYLAGKSGMCFIHNTHVATTIGGRAFPTPWGIVKGVAPDVDLGFFKCLGYGIGSGTNTSVLRAMMDAFQWNADLVNMSLGGDVKPDERHEIDRCPICRAVRMLSESGMIFAVAAGNSGVGYASCPGIAPEAITIAAVDSSGRIADFTSRRHTQYLDYHKPDASAPGVNLLSSTVGLIDLMEWMDGPKLAAISGTSMATPMACGVIALWIQYARDRGFKLSYRDIHECIRMGRGWDPDYGYGIIRYEWIKDYLRR